MEPRKEEGKASGYLLESAGGMASLARCVAHPARMQIMALAMGGGASFGELREQTELSKTALANHLGRMVEHGLVHRLSRGEYVLTVDGRDLLTAIASSYRCSKRRAEHDRDRLRRSYAEILAGGGKPEAKEIELEVSYPSCWLSYLGAMAGSLGALGVNCSTADVGGYSGYSFLINVARGETCPSGPTALHIRTFRQMVRGTERLGWKIETYTYPHGYPAREGRPTPREIGVVRSLFDRIKNDIDKNGRPVVLWGLVAPEYGIVRGYEKDAYLVNTFRGSLNPDVPEEPVSFQDLKAPGCIDAFFFKGKLHLNQTRARREALEQCLDMAEGNVHVLPNYVAGPLALDEWAGALEELPQNLQNYMGNSYVGACVGEGLALSGTFLKKVSKKLPARSSRCLTKAASGYRRSAKLMDSFTKMFPFKFEGQMPLEKRRKGARILRAVRSIDESAIRFMKRGV